MKKVLLMAPMASTLELFCRANIELLRELGYKVHLAANFRSGSGEQLRHNLEYISRAEKEGITVHPIDFERRTLFRNLGALAKLKMLLREESFDLIHAHTETGGLLLRLALRQAQGSRLVYTPHGMSFYEGSSLKSRIIYKPVERRICAVCDAVIAINSEELDVLRRWNPETAYFTHGIGVDVSAPKEADRALKRAELGIPPEAVLLCSVGELSERKNHITCIRALAKTGNPDIYYLICGVGELDDELRFEAEKLGIGSRVVFAGYRRDVPDILACSDIFAFPSYQEGLPVALMEAMAAGLPVICSKIRGNVDLISEGEGGCLLEPDNSEGFARAILKLADAPELRQKLGEHNREAVKGFGKEIVKGELRNVYSGAAEK